MYDRHTGQGQGGRRGNGLFKIYPGARDRDSVYTDQQLAADRNRRLLEGAMGNPGSRAGMHAGRGLPGAI